MGPSAFIAVCTAEPSKQRRGVSREEEKESPCLADALQSPPDATPGEHLEWLLFCPQTYLGVK